MKNLKFLRTLIALVLLVGMWEGFTYYNKKKDKESERKNERKKF